MVVFSLERNKPYKCKTSLLFCLPDWELTEGSIIMVNAIDLLQVNSSILLCY